MTATTTTLTTTIAHSNPALALTLSPLNSYRSTVNSKNSNIMVPNLALSGLTGSVTNYDNLASPSSITNPIISMPVRNRSFSSTPRLIESTTNQQQQQFSQQQQPSQPTLSFSDQVQSARQRPITNTNNKDEKQQSAQFNSYTNSGFNSDRSNLADFRPKQQDSRLIIPVQHKTSNVSINSSTNSIIDESKSLLREYEQLRSDSVSEIQRAHDSLNARYFLTIRLMV